MAKKSVARKKSKPTPCKSEGCKRPTAYMKRNRKSGNMDHWCAPHWKTEVEAKNPADYRDQKPKSASKPAKKIKRKVKK